MKNKSSDIYLTSLGLVNALGFGKRQVFDNLLKGDAPGMQYYQSPIMNKNHFCGVVQHELPTIPERFSAFNCRNNQLVLAAVSQIENDIEHAKKLFGANRIGLVMATSTSGIAEAELALQIKQKSGALPDDYHYKMQELGAIAEFLGEYLAIEGPCYTISTACSSSGKIFASAKRLLELDICDAVVVGGADSLCDLTLGGFDSLEAVSPERTMPFSVNRKGINIGEAAAIFLMTKTNLKKISDDSLQKTVPVTLLGVGETSDAYHMSAPEPHGQGASSAMLAALDDAELTINEIDYINLHGTGTRLNDSMEASAVNQLFGSNTLCSSTKPLTGHTLGAAGATEIALCWLLLSNTSEKRLAPHIFDGQFDPEISVIKLVPQEEKVDRMRIAMSNSFAFGGNNVSVIIGSCGKHNDGV